MKKTLAFTLLTSSVLFGCGAENVAKSNSAADVTASYNSINKEQLTEHKIGRAHV